MEGRMAQKRKKLRQEGCWALPLVRTRRRIKTRRKKGGLLALILLYAWLGLLLALDALSSLTRRPAQPATALAPHTHSGSVRPSSRLAQPERPGLPRDLLRLDLDIRMVRSSGIRAEQALRRLRERSPALEEYFLSVIEQGPLGWMEVQRDIKKAMRQPPAVSAIGRERRALAKRACLPLWIERGSHLRPVASFATPLDDDHEGYAPSPPGLRSAER